MKASVCMKSYDKTSISFYFILIIDVINSVLNIVGYQTNDYKILNNLVEEDFLSMWLGRTII